MRSSSPLAARLRFAPRPNAVWKAHKPHCGPGKADPFFIEPLSDEEIADLRQRARLPVVKSDPVGISTVEQDLVAASGLPFEYIVEHLTGPVDDPVSLPEKPYLVGLVRSSRFANAATAEASRMSVDSIRNAFVTVVMSCFKRAGLLPVHPHSAPWFTPLNHKLVVVASLTYIWLGFVAGHARDLPIEPVLDKIMVAYELLPVAREQVTKWVHDGFGTGDLRYKRALARVTFQWSNGP
ncbi:hypothetical protein JCM3775_000092 [Rhodotorula graminis]